MPWIFEKQTGQNVHW